MRWNVLVVVLDVLDAGETQPGAEKELSFCLNLICCSSLIYESKRCWWLVTIVKGNEVVKRQYFIMLGHSHRRMPIAQDGKLACVQLDWRERETNAIVNICTDRDGQIEWTTSEMARFAQSDKQITNRVINFACPTLHLPRSSLFVSQCVKLNSWSFSFSG